ncbi:AraC family transcriptional regulator [Pseudomonas agarici]|uniref:AraC family transcriptional regulator n=1 Tax=Pseudomonas agarici TaxID=46677 RepID=A0A0X1T3M0_PSEAA|nr:GlxA family transcriptional regulator [Pseudomonas agarici]AMB86459.1 AraC family transcriptional regulator [Pseudomonas agarici]NWB93735.1 GlxA family transcriptional regulator [Pseudomonas agarici]NWC09345.1 GlxA family transcriptional regulator [Pseudomonas agarici]SEL46837.1 transcriptional regulator, AraC family with amidase-like domain [Pseudomonas agarici]
MTSPRESAMPVYSDTTKRIGLLILPQFSMMALAGASEPLRAANRLSGKALYEWTLLTESGGAVSSSSGIEIQTLSIEQAPEVDRIFVLASLDIEHQKPPRMIRFLQRAAARGKTVGALSTGTFILARAGLLEGKRCTLHWECIAQFSEEFPTIEVTRDLYVNHGNRWTCGGGTAAIDLMLAQIALDYGSQLAASVAEQFLHARIRAPEEHQRMSIQWRFGVHDKRLTVAIAVMENNLESIVGIEEIADRCNLSHRQLERLWHQHFGMTPKKFYLELRLSEARRLLRESTQPIVSIAYSCGFVSASHLGAAYRRVWGCTPGEERRKFDGAHS